MPLTTMYKVFRVELKMHDKLKRKNAITSGKYRITSKKQIDL